MLSMFGGYQWVDWVYSRLCIFSLSPLVKQFDTSKDEVQSGRSWWWQVPGVGRHCSALINIHKGHIVIDACAPIPGDMLNS